MIKIPVRKINFLLKISEIEINVYLMFNLLPKVKGIKLLKI